MLGQSYEGHRLTPSPVPTAQADTLKPVPQGSMAKLKFSTTGKRTATTVEYLPDASTVQGRNHSPHFTDEPRFREVE